MAVNPNPSRVTDAMWWLWEQCHALEPTTQLGGFYALKSGYHSTRADNLARWPGNYSIRDAVDLQGPADKSAAFDWTFPDAQVGRYEKISKYCSRLMKSGKDKNDPRLDGLREWYGQADADNAVEGWDCRYLREITSDSSHLWHIHKSFSRAHVNDMDVMKAVFSVLKGETVEQWKAGGAPASNSTEVDELGQASETVVYELRPWTADIARTTERIEATVKQVAADQAALKTNLLDLKADLAKVAAAVSSQYPKSA